VLDAGSLGAAIAKCIGCTTRLTGRNRWRRFRWFLYGARQRYAAAVTFFGLQRAVLYLGQMYIVLNSEAHVLEFIRQFDGLIRAAVVQPPEVADLLRNLRKEITSSG